MSGKLEVFLQELDRNLDQLEYAPNLNMATPPNVIAAIRQAVREAAETAKILGFQASEGVEHE